MNLPGLARCEACDRWYTGACPTCGAAAPPAPRRSKYRNEPVVVDGLRFASKREAQRWGELRLRARLGEVADLHRQAPYACVVAGVQVCVYVADFVYRDVPTGRWHVEDAKGVRTAVYRLKKRLMKACHNIDVEEV